MARSRPLRVGSANLARRARRCCVRLLAGPTERPPHRRCPPLPVARGAFARPRIFPPPRTRPCPQRGPKPTVRTALVSYTGSKHPHPHAVRATSFVWVEVTGAGIGPNPRTNLRTNPTGTRHFRQRPKGPPRALGCDTLHPWPICNHAPHRSPHRRAKNRPPNHLTPDIFRLHPPAHPATFIASQGSRVVPGLRWGRMPTDPSS